MTNRSALPRARSVQGRGQCYKCIEKSGERRRGVERGGEGMGRGMGLSIADIPLAAFRRDDRLGKIDLCRGSSRWMGQSTKSISHHPHDIGPLSPFSARFYPLYALYGADRYVRSPLVPSWPIAIGAPWNVNAFTKRNCVSNFIYDYLFTSSETDLCIYCGTSV